MHASKAIKKSKRKVAKALPCPFRVERDGLPTTEFVGHRTGLDDSRLFYLDILPLIIFVFSLGMAVGKYCV